MAADHLQFLKDKFSTDLGEALDGFNEGFPLRRHFHEVAVVLQERDIGPYTPIAMKNELYDLRYLLAECVMWAEREQDRKSQDKKIQLDAWHVKKLWFLRKTGKKLLRIKKKLQRMSDDAETCWSSSLPGEGTIRACSVWDSSRFPRDYASQTYGLEDEFQSMNQLLLQTPRADAHGLKTVAIVGMGGVGKTTLARRFVDSHVTKHLFSPIIWVRLSKDTTPSQIVTHLLETLRGLYEAKEYSHQRARDYALNNFYSCPRKLREMRNLLWGKKYLIVLDNVCHEDDWYSRLGSIPPTDGATCFAHLSDGFPKGGGGAIIVTTRFQTVGRSMVGDRNLIRLQPTYGAEELWSMFMDSIGRKKFLVEHHHETLSRMKNEIIDRCDGLPLAAMTLAEVISIQVGQGLLWSDPNPNLWKRVSLKMDEPDEKSYFNIIKKAETYPGVIQILGDHKSEITMVTGIYDVVQLVRELGKFCPMELIGVDIVGS